MPTTFRQSMPTCRGLLCGAVLVTAGLISGGPALSNPAEATTTNRVVNDSPRNWTPNADNGRLSGPGIDGYDWRARGAFGDAE